MRGIFVLFLFIIFSAETIYGLSSSDKIRIKNGKEYQIEVEKVINWGLCLNDNRTVLFKVLSEFTTQNMFLIEQIQNIFPTIKIIMNSDSSYTLYFENISVPKIERKEFRYFDNISINSLTMFGKYSDIEVQYIFDPSFIKFLIWQVGQSFSWHNVDETVNYFSTPYISRHKYKTIGYHIGIGGLIKYLSTEFNFNINYSVSFASIKTSKTEGYWKFQRTIKDENSYLYFGINRTILKSLSIILGCRYYFDDFKEKFESNRFHYVVGVGLNINNI